MFLVPKICWLSRLESPLVFCCFRKNNINIKIFLSYVFTVKFLLQLAFKKQVVTSWYSSRLFDDQNVLDKSVWLETGCFDIQIQHLKVGS